MQLPFQVDRFHFNNLLGGTVVGDWFSGFNLEDQIKVKCLVFNEAILSDDQVQELQRVNHILAQREFKSILQPLAWGLYEGRHYLVLPDFGTPLSSFENLKALPPGELLAILRRLLRGLCFAEAKEVTSHQSLRPDNIYISLEDSQVKLGYFGYPMIDLASDIALTDDAAQLLSYFPPKDMQDAAPAPFQYDLYALGLMALELATARMWNEVLSYDDQHASDSLRKKLSELENMPLPLQELLYKLLTPALDERYSNYQQALDDVLQLVGQDESGLSLQTFILDTLISGRFKLGEEISSGRISRIFSAVDTRGEEGPRQCVVKLVDLRAHPNLAGVFHTRFRQLLNLDHEHLLGVYDVGVHFELGFIAMESGLQSLEDLLIKRGTLPLSDAGRIVYQLSKALTTLQENDVPFHGAIKPSNVFLTPDLRTVKLGDALTAEFFLSQGNLNFIGAEYYNPEFIKNVEQDVRSDIYDLGTLFFEMLVGHPPFSFKIEQEIIQDHLNSNAATRVEQALFSSGGKDIILRMLEKNPSARHQSTKELMDELGALLGYDKKEVVHVPNIFFDFAELSMVGKNAREKSEETLSVRLPAVNNRARGAMGLIIGHGTQVGDASKAATGALKAVREMLFNPGSISPDFARLQKSDPETYLERLVMQLNQRVYREAFATGKTQKYGVSAVIGMIQENTLYLYQIGTVAFYLFNKGEILDYRDDKWTIYEELELGDRSVALSSEVHERVGFGEMVRAKRLKRRIKDADQLVLLSSSLSGSLSVSEIKELVTSSSDPAQAIELVRGDAIRRRLEGTISCVLLSIGNVVAFADETVSHSKKGMLARNFLNQGDTYLSDGRIDEAIEQFNQALEINPNFAIIHHQLGVAYTRKGLPSYAMSCFERAIELNEKLAASYVEIAKLLRQQKRFREVLPLLRRAVASGGKDPELFAMLAGELIKVRNYDEAILYATHALNMNSAHPTAFRDRMIAIKRRSALDTKVLKMFGTRPRLADDKRTRIEDRIEVEVEEDEWKN